MKHGLGKWLGWGGAPRLWLLGCGCWLALATAALAQPDRDIYDLFFYDQTANGTVDRLTINMPQFHTLAGPDDEDWAWFRPAPGLPYTIQVSQVGTGIDPELWVYPEGPDQPGFKTDLNGPGGGESWSRLSWPWTGRCWVCVRSAAPPAAGPVTYQLTVTRDTGANLGLATISGTKLGVTQSGPQTLSLPGSVPMASGESFKPLYGKSELVCGEGAFAPEAQSVLLLAGLGDPLENLSQPWVTRWHERFPQNLTITRLGIAPPVDPAKPLLLTIQMRAQTATLDLSDDETTWPGLTARDVSPGARPDQVTVYRWDLSAGDWVVFDDRPLVRVDADGDWLVQTRIAKCPLQVYSSDIYAAAVPPGAAAAGWTAYE